MKYDGFDPVSNTSPWTSFLRLLDHPTRVEVLVGLRQGGLKCLKIVSKWEGRVYIMMKLCHYGKDEDFSSRICRAR